MKFEDFANRFEKRKPTKNGFMVVCPAHADSPKGPSLSIGKSRDGGVMVKCFAGCTSEAIVGALGLKMKDLFAEERPVHFTPPPVRESAGDKQDDNVKPVIEKIYDYTDGLGGPLYQAIRMKPKSFRQRHMVDGNWVWSMDGVERVLYRLPKVLNSDTVILVEGEKDADNLCALGYAASCNVGGAGKWLDGYTESLEGKHVIICGDNDEPGLKHVNLIFDSVAGAAKTVKVVKLPPHVKDASDFIATFKTKEEAKTAFDELVSQAYPHIKGLRLPIFSVSELEPAYKRYTAAMETSSFSLGKWLPSLGKLRPLVPGELVFVIGNTGTGKTGILQQIAKCAMPLPTLMFELELPDELIFERFVSNVTNFTCRQVEEAYRACPEESMASALDSKLGKLFVCTESKLTLEQLENYIVRAELKIGEKPKLVLVDYLQLVQGMGSNRREKISDIAEGLKVLAKSTRTIIIATSQIKRPDDAEPEVGLHDGKESGSIESSCGLLLGAWRDKEDAGLLHIKVLKSTKGGAGLQIPCNFNGERMVITERDNRPSPSND